MLHVFINKLDTVWIPWYFQDTVVWKRIELISVEKNVIFVALCYILFNGAHLTNCSLNLLLSIKQDTV